MIRYTTVIAAFFISFASIAEENDFDPSYAEFFGNAEFEGTIFANDASDAFDETGGIADRDNLNISVAVQPSLLMEWGSDVAVTVKPFVRIDQHDKRRSHFDMREAKLDLYHDEWSLTLGFDSVFWGKTEALHLVDIINQDDTLEDSDGEDKLGQPMVRLSRSFDIGTFTGFYMPYFRERPHLGSESRLRPSASIESGAEYEDGENQWTPAFAVRWTHVIGDADIGFSGFHGLSRDPAFQPTAFGILDGQPAIARVKPVYDVISQVGFDGQYTSDATLWKLETIYRWGQRNALFEAQNYVAVTGGFEHSLYGIADTNADLGLIVEYAWDQRGDETFNPLQNDVILGARLALNDSQDTSALITTSIDSDNQEATVRLEAERRLMDGWKLSLEGGAFLNTNPGGTLYDLRDDAYVRARLTFYW